MVNVKNLFGMAVMATALVGCSSNDDVTNPNPDQGKTGEAYAAFNINLPTVSGSRAATYEDGDPKEFEVKNATLVVFEKSGNDYKWVENVDLGDMAPWAKDNGEGVTTKATMVAKLSSVSLSGTNYYALVLLNNKVGGNVKVTLPSTNDTFASWNKAANVNVTNLLNNTDGYYMANAPLYTEDGKEPTTLVAIDKIYSTKAQAESSTGNTVYVERGMSKVTVDNFTITEGENPTGTKYENDKVEIAGWALDVTNKFSFPVHSVDGLLTSFGNIWNYTSPVTDNVENGKKYGTSTKRFVGAGEVNRVYWGVDPNYSNDYTLEGSGQQFTLLASNAEVTGSAGIPQYCAENTFDIAHMKQGQTTRVVFKANYSPANITPGANFYKIGNSTDIWSEENLEKLIIAKAQEVLNESDESKITVDMSANGLNEAGTRLLAVGDVKHNGTDLTSTEIANVNAKLGLKAATTTSPIVGIATYKSGVCYYIARIKHFGDTETKWVDGDDTYANNNLNWLGRYGVLRNNWYSLSINSVSGPGYPDVPTVKPDEPDDESDKYISISVKILDWAKRSQQVDL